jgi:Protein of unknown function (DUF3617)
MRKPILVASCLAVFVVVLFAADEQPLDVKPGLWQLDTMVKYTGLPAQYQAMLDRLTPEQKSAMGLGTAHTRKTCRTAKTLNTSWVEGDQNCKWTVLKSTSSDLEVHGTSCRMGKNEGWNSGVDVKIHVADNEHLRGSIHGTATGTGINATLDGNYTGKWLGASCPADMK